MGDLVTDLLSPAAVRDPYGVYAGLREAGPVVWLPEHHAWFVSTYDGVHAAFRDLRLTSDRLTPLEQRLSPDKRAVLGPTFELLRGWMVFHDPPGHERLKGPVRRAFTPRAVESLRPFVTQVVARCLDEVEARLRDGEVVDLKDALAFPVPAIVIAELLGVPPGDRDAFKTWSAQLALVVFGASGDPRQAETAAAGTRAFAEYFTGLVAERERSPRDDLISALLAARDEADPPLGGTELVGALTLLLFGGHETTTNLIGNAVVSLDEHRDERRWLHEHPDGIVNAVEELHRYDGSSKVMVRVVADAHERDGVTMAPGQTVFLGIGSANRDPAAFPDPDSLHLQRPDAHKHLGFGYGLHFCLGAPLARLELQIALGSLVQRLPDLVVAPPEGGLRYGATILGRGVTSLPVALDRR